MAEPIAICGLSCRLPGGSTTPEAFWERVLAPGACVVGEVPPERWPAHAENGNARFGGFLDEDPALFDTGFFGLSPREARTLDPQQRIGLELAWEAIEDAGVDPHSLKGSNTGVFLGVGIEDYGRRTFWAQSPSEVSGYDITGILPDACSGRIAYTLGLEGPTLSVKTACSSALVALSLAVRALRAGDCDAAIVGGLNLLLSPRTFTYLAELDALSPTGRCHTFDASADGYVRGEGGVFLFLRKDPGEGRIRAVLRAATVNQDGRSNGFTAPSARAQQKAIRAALSEAELEPGDVGLIEAHGTGTPLGDPIEMDAIRATYGPTWVGSAKTNVGHLEAAAGGVGLLKGILALERGQIPAHVGLEEPNPRLQLDGFTLPDTLTDWPDDRPKRVAVSAFGLTGTNAHCIVESSPTRSAETTQSDVHLVCFSGTTPAARDAAIGLPADLPLGDVAFTRNTGRAHHAWRWAAVVSDGELPDTRDLPSPVKGDLAFAFTGQGAQSPGMGGRLRDAEPVFREAFDAIVDAFEARGVPLSEAMSDERIHDTTFTQPALFALEVALARLWAHWGVVPDLVIGHSIGEIAAVHVAGALSLDDAVTLVEARGRLMGELPTGGAMAALLTDEARVRGWLVPGAEIAGLNHPGETVVSGTADAVDAVLAAAEKAEVHGKRLTVSHAFHSALMEPMLEAFKETIRGLNVTEPHTPIISNRTGQIATMEHLGSADYWADHVRHAVRFADGVRTLQAEGVGLVLELGPHPVLCGMGRQTAPDLRFVGSLNRKEDDERAILDALAAVYGAGVDIAWPVFHTHRPGNWVTLPPYPFQRGRHWIEPLTEGREVLPIHRLAWSPTTAPEGAEPERWHVVGRMGAAVAEALQRAGHEATAGELSDLTDVDGVIYLGYPFDGRDEVFEALEVAKACADAESTHRLVLMAGGGAPLDHPVPRPDQGTLHGLGIALYRERPDLHVLTLDVSEEPDWDAVVAGLGHPGPRLAWESGQWWSPAFESVPPGAPIAIRDDRSYWVTGGLGALGQVVAAWLVDQGAGEVILTSRTPREVDLPRTRVIAADVADADRAVEVVEAMEYPIGGLIHAAGILRDAALPNQTAEAMAEVFAAKVKGTDALLDAVAGEDLDFVAFFSSAAATLGSPGQANYAAANGYLDASASALRLRGVHAVSIAWGPWGGSGMAEGLEPPPGVVPIDPLQAVSTLEAVLGGKHANVLVVGLDEGARFQGQDLHPPELVEAAAHPREFAASSPTEEVPEAIRRLASEVLGHDDPTALDADTPLVDQGLDSLMAVELRNRIHTTLGVSVPMALIMKGPSLDQLTEAVTPTITRPAIQKSPDGEDPTLITSPPQLPAEDAQMGSLVAAGLAGAVLGGGVVYGLMALF